MAEPANDKEGSRVWHGCQTLVAMPCWANSTGNGIPNLVCKPVAKGRGDTKQRGEHGNEHTDKGRDDITKTVPAGPLSSW